MAELEPQNSTPDPLAKLHKMSTTAGIASADYVAISNLAVGSAVLGALTAFSWMTPYLGFIGLAGIIFGVLSLRKIANSNGTQTGKGIAVLGIVLSILLAGVGLGREYLRDRALQADKDAIDAQIGQLGKALVAGDAKAVYDMFDPVWRSLTSVKDIEQQLRRIHETVGKITRADPNRLYAFSSAGGERLIETRIRMFFEKTGDRAETIAITFHEQPDKTWLPIYYDLFPAVNPFKKQSGASGQ